MANKKRNRRTIAQWRYEQIEDALHEDLQPEGRGQVLKPISQTPVLWPSGKFEPVSLATLYRWIQRYAQQNMQGLMPKVRSDRGKARLPLPAAVIEAAINYLMTDPSQSLTFLVKVLEAEFAEQQLVIAPATLQRRLAAHPSYSDIQRARKHTRRRTRFSAAAPHDIWQTDAKGPVSVRLTNGAMLTFHVVSVIDDATRAVLAAIVAMRVNLAAAVRAFRMAALRWGLPKQLYADRASIFDSSAFRSGLAQMGSYRIPTRARNAEARGKIEAYHRVLVGWFFKRLPHQQVMDLLHLQQLLDGVIDSLYQTHKHRSIGCPPAQALKGIVSERYVPPTRLYEAFVQVRNLKAHRKTGEVVIDGVTYLVPDELRGQHLCFLVDPVGETEPMVKDPTSHKPRALRRAQLAPKDHEHAEKQPSVRRWGAGPLQVITDQVRGQRRPLGEPGFGLPEIYAQLSQLAGRHVPQSDAEAALVQRIYREAGPWGRASTEAAMTVLRQTLGPDRPIKTYLDALVARVVSDDVEH